jgi:hypothetical protein
VGSIASGRPFAVVAEGGDGEVGIDFVAVGEEADAATVGSTSVRVMTPFSNSKEKNAGLFGLGDRRCEPDELDDAVDLLRRGADGDRCPFFSGVAGADSLGGGTTTPVSIVVGRGA